MNGEIVWYNPDRHYGFVAPSEGGGDIVFHLDAADLAALGAPARGMAVHFVLAQGPAGPVARRLEPGHMPEV
jgi:CspA family cold shock protein